MRESLLVVLGIVLLLVTAALEPPTGIRVGLGSSVVGLFIGILAGGLYHHRLHASLSARDALPPRWWIDPTKLHPTLTDAERQRTLPSFYVGAGSFALCVIGCVSMLSALARLML